MANTLHGCNQIKIGALVDSRVVVSMIIRATLDPLKQKTALHQSSLSIGGISGTVTPVEDVTYIIITIEGDSYLGRFVVIVALKEQWRDIKKEHSWFYILFIDTTITAILV